MLTVDIALPDVEELQKLVQTGLEPGFTERWRAVAEHALSRYNEQI